MKNLVTCLFILLSFQFNGRLTKAKAGEDTISPAGNIFVITLDGFRWQEVFTGADSELINDEKYTPDTATIKSLFWSPDIEGRRKKLLPFFWNIVAARGQLYGNRLFKNKMNNSNPYSLSYPGYNEIFSGAADISVSSNSKHLNTNINVLEYLNARGEFKGKVVAFTSWDVFPYILNETRSQIEVNSGYEQVNSATGPANNLINKVQERAVNDKTTTRHDLLTFLVAREYIDAHRPRVVFLGLGETDEAAHNGRYDLYLEKAAEADQMIARLWHYVQTTAGYKDNTTFIITTDHGRGKTAGSWTDHGLLIGSSSQTWLAILGPTIPPAGEIKEDGQLFQKQIAQTIAELMGERFTTGRYIADAISLK